jgi:hypothetical protein
MWAWHLPKTAPTMGLFLSRSFWNSFDAANKKGSFYTGGGGIFVQYQERKAENEECL